MAKKLPYSAQLWTDREWLSQVKLELRNVKEWLVDGINCVGERCVLGYRAAVFFPDGMEFGGYHKTWKAAIQESVKMVQNTHWTIFTESAN